MRIQPRSGRLVERLVEPADIGIAVVGVFALGVGVVDDEAQGRGAVLHRGPLEHLQVAIRVAEGDDRAAADEAVDADRFARPVVDKVDFRHAEQDRLGRPAFRIAP